MTKKEIEKFVGSNIRITMIDDCIFEGVLWFVKYTDNDSTEVDSICLSSSKYNFRIEHIKKFEKID